MMIHGRSMPDTLSRNTLAPLQNLEPARPSACLRHTLSVPVPDTCVPCPAPRPVSSPCLSRAFQTAREHVTPWSPRASGGAGPSATVCLPSDMGVAPTETETQRRRLEGSG